MKHLMILASGAADDAVESLSGRTPLEAARKPALDELARAGKTGLVRTIPDDLPASEETALLSALGYAPAKHFAGEAGLGAGDAPFTIGDALAFRHSLVTEADGIVQDHAAGQISPREADQLLTALNSALGRPGVQFHVGRGFSGITRLPQSGWEKPECLPPEGVLGKSFARHLPQGEGSELPRKVIELSQEVFREHEVNRVRADLGENPATLLWLWGPGNPPALPSFESEYKRRAAMVAAAESARGLARLAGMRVADVPGATGGYRTDYAAKAACALKLIEEFDLVVVHVASPAEAGLAGDAERKVAALSDIDAMVVAPLFEFAARRGDVRVMFLATHVCSVVTRSRLRRETPVALFGPGMDPFRRAGFSEAHAANGEVDVKQGSSLLSYFFRE